MHLTKLAKDDKSGIDGCPAVYIAEDESLVVQGPLVDTDTHDRLHNPLPGESAVHIDLSVVAKALEHYHGETAT